MGLPPHYGRDVTAMFYTHVSGRHAPYNTVAIPPSGEAAYVIDGLLYHEADMTIATHHTDGGGVSDHVFGLAHLLGFRFAPPRPAPLPDRWGLGAKPDVVLPNLYQLQMVQRQGLLKDRQRALVEGLGKVVLALGLIQEGEVVE